jgi:hypothetical protein
MNLFPIPVESGLGTGKFALVGSPGTKLFTTLAGSPVRGLWAGANGYRLFAVGGSRFYEVYPDGTMLDRGDVGAGTDQVQINTNGGSLFIASGGLAYIDGGLNITQPTFTGTTDPVLASGGTSMDGYFIAPQPNSKRFYISGINEGLSWDPLDFGEKVGYPDNIATVTAKSGELWLIGTDSLEVWFNSGNNNFPFARIPNAVLNTGIDAVASLARLDNDLIFLARDSRGSKVVVRTKGYTPTPVSNLAVDSAIGKYAVTADAVAYTYEEEGTPFYVLNFPSADACWVMDCSTNLWHERGYWEMGGYHTTLGQSHAYAFGKHFVAGNRSGKIYEQSMEIFDDAGSPIRRLRRSPHLVEENKRIQYGRFELDLERGMGPSAGQGSDPLLSMRYSNDGGRTWTQERTARAGKVGEFDCRAIWRRQSAGRNRVYEVTSSEPIRHVWTDAYVGPQVLG